MRWQIPDTMFGWETLEEMFIHANTYNMIRMVAVKIVKSFGRLRGMKLG